MKLYQFIVPEAFDGRLPALIRRMLPELPEYAVREAFANRDVKLDGRRVRRDAVPDSGMLVQVYVSGERQLPPPEIVYEDEQLLIVDKPVGCSCEPDAKGGKTILDRLMATERYEQPLLLCHRLDNPTDGLLLIAKNPAAQEAMQAAFAERLIQKKYTCLVKGAPEPQEASLCAYLLKDAQAAKVRVYDAPRPNALTILTDYRVLEAGEISRLEVTLHTGRTHQIRAQMAHIGHPLLGDDLYGDRAFNREHKAKRLMLTATELSFHLTGDWAYLNNHVWHKKPTF